jgi:hypothetical protein
LAAATMPEKEASPLEAASESKCHCRHDMLCPGSATKAKGFAARHLCCIRLGIALQTMKAGLRIARWGIHRLHSDCPLRRCLESLTPLVERALSSSSTKRKITS